VKILSIIGIFISILGFFGALRFSSFLFGFFSMGLFLLIYSLITKKEVPPTSHGLPALTKPTSHSIEQLLRFCPKCGAELDMSEGFCPICGEKVKK